MLVGGIDAHRYDLSSMVMLKDNHIWSKGEPLSTHYPFPAKLLSLLSLQLALHQLNQADLPSPPSFFPLSRHSPHPHLSFHTYSQNTLAGSITSAVLSARSISGFSLRIEVECQSLDEAREAIAAGADVVMLDNLEGEELFSAARVLKEEWRAAQLQGGVTKGFLIESSGNVEEGNLKGRLSNSEIFVFLLYKFLFERGRGMSGRGGETPRASRSVGRVEIEAHLFFFAFFCPSFFLFSFTDIDIISTSSVHQVRSLLLSYLLLPVASSLL